MTLMVVRSDRLGGLRFAFQAAARDLTAAGENGGYSLLEHLLQCAHVLAACRPDDDELAVAGLVHDLGHVLGDGGEDRHGEVAADFLRPLLGDRVADLVALHVPAKRYLMAVADGYGELLSPASAASLSDQGSAMSVDEQRSFETHPRAADAVLLRKADDLAKQAGRPVPGLDRWWPLLEDLVAGL